MPLHEKVVDWDDSAGKEAFDNAKTRFWEEMNGIPCNLSLPDPDIYIDNVDWDLSVDPELIQDLEREPTSSDVSNNEVVILGSSQLLNCTGWTSGVEVGIQPTGWGDSEENVRVDHPTGCLGASTDQAREDTIPFPCPTGLEDSDVNINSGATGFGETERDLTKDSTPFPPPCGRNPELKIFDEEGEENIPKATDLFPASQGGGQSNVQANGSVGSWEQQYYVPQQPANIYEWQNYETQIQQSNVQVNGSVGSWEQQYDVPQQPAEVYEWQNYETQTQQHRGHGDFLKIGSGRGSGNWGRCDGYNNRRRENIPWNKGNGADIEGDNEYQMGGRGRRNYRGRKKGNFAYGENMATTRWQVKIK